MQERLPCEDAYFSGKIPQGGRICSEKISQGGRICSEKISQGGHICPEKISRICSGFRKDIPGRKHIFQGKSYNFREGIPGKTAYLSQRRSASPPPQRSLRASLWTASPRIALCWSVGPMVWPLEALSWPPLGGWPWPPVGWSWPPVGWSWPLLDELSCYWPSRSRGLRCGKIHP